MSSSSTLIPQKKYKKHLASNEFLKGFNLQWRISGATLAITLFFVWTIQIRPVADYTLLALVLVYSVLVLGFMLLRRSQLEYLKHEDSIEVLFIRPADIWDTLLDCFTASGLIFAGCIFFLSNIISALSWMAVFAALIITVFLAPIAPMIASILFFDFMKTSVLLRFDQTGENVTEITIAPHSLERLWNERKDDEELKSELAVIFQTILSESIS